MLGGYQILDLRKIDLSRGTSEASITDAEVLKQISNLRDHIQKTYDFSKPLQNQLKPLLIRYRDQKVGEKHEVALYGNIEVINVYYKFRIIACNESEKLTINVEFEEKTDEYDNKYWDIKTAKILLTKEVQDFENITDSKGHKRFIEGDITISEISGVTKTYGKWALSGSHLIIVLVLSIADVTSIADNTTLCAIDVPQWIKDKIVPVVGGTVAFNVDYAYASDYTNQQLHSRLVKPNGSVLQIRNDDAWSLTKNRTIRTVYDLLIDNE